VSRILTNLDGATGEFEQLIRELSDTRSTVDGLIGRVNLMLDEEEGDVHRALRELNHSLAAVSRHIDAIASNLEATTRNMNEFSRHIRNDPGLLVRGREQGEEP
jgi:phospholipid/cholesterol/gamma-HCH transport system substrate-binding protein